MYPLWITTTNNNKNFTEQKKLKNLEVSFLKFLSVETKFFFATTHVQLCLKQQQQQQNKKLIKQKKLKVKL
jgi:hypothetical protein